MRLSSKHKQFIVRELACFATPTEVKAALTAEFGLSEDAVNLPQLVQYDPTKPAGEALGRDLRALFEKTRETYIAELFVIPAAHRAFRVRRLAAMAKKAEDRGNFPLAKDLLRQIAEEMGGKFTNRFEVAGSLDTLAKLFGMTPEQVDAVLQGATG